MVDRIGTAATPPSPQHAKRARRASGSGRRALGLVVAAAAVVATCAGPGAPASIVYPYPWLSRDLAHVAQAAIDSWGTPPVVRVVDSLPSQMQIPPGYAGDVAFAQAMAALPGTLVAVGPQSSRATLLVSPIYTRRDIPLIAATATSSRLRFLGRWIFQLPPDDDVEGAFIADFVLDRLGARRVTVFYLDEDEYGLGLRDGVVRALRRRGVAPVDEVGIIEQSDFARRVDESLRRARPEVVVVAARSNQTLGIARALHARLPGAKVVAGDGTPLNATFIGAAGAAAAGVYAVAWWHYDLPDSASRSFAARYRAAAGRLPSPAEAMYYDAIMVAANAVRDAGPHAAAIRRWLSALGVSLPPYRGVTGPISFAPGRTVNLLMTRVAGDTAAVVGGGEARP